MHSPWVLSSQLAPCRMTKQMRKCSEDTHSHGWPVNQAVASGSQPEGLSWILTLNNQPVAQRCWRICMCVCVFCLCVRMWEQYVFVGLSPVLREQVNHRGLSISGCITEFPLAILKRKEDKTKKRERDACLTPFKRSQRPVSQSSNPISSSHFTALSSSSVPFLLDLSQPSSALKALDEKLIPRSNLHSAFT